MKTDLVYIVVVQSRKYCMTEKQWSNLMKTPVKKELLGIVRNGRFFSSRA